MFITSGMSANAKSDVAPARDPVRTRARILDAAKAEFSELGLGGARVDGIALRASVNKRMLYHYFGGKDDLFLAVLEAAYADIRDAEKALKLEHLEPVEAIRTLVTFTWNYYLENPEFLRLVNSENLHKARHLEGSIVIRDLHAPFVAMVGDILMRGETDGSFRGGIDPVQIIMSIAALGYYYLTNRYTSSILFDRDLMAPKELDARLTHIVDTVLGYLRP